VSTAAAGNTVSTPAIATGTEPPSGPRSDPGSGALGRRRISGAPACPSESAAAGVAARLSRVCAGDCLLGAAARSDLSSDTPAGPAVSAWANAGIATTDAPIPKATASAPTRPTHRVGTELSPGRRGRESVNTAGRLTPDSLKLLVVPAQQLSLPNNSAGRWKGRCYGWQSSCSWDWLW
jgi:hypothetical protein